MKWKLKKSLSKRKTETVRSLWSQSVWWWVWVSIRFFEKMCFSLEWKSECVMDDVNGDDEGEEDCLRQDWRSETGSLFQKWGDACRKERFVIFNEELAGGMHKWCKLVTSNIWRNLLLLPNYTCMARCQVCWCNNRLQTPL